MYVSSNKFPLAVVGCREGRKDLLTHCGLDRCIGTFRFLDFSLMRHPAYGEVLTRTKQGQKFLDIGCCLGSDVRALIHDGAPASNVFGLDVKDEFIDLGYDLFVDEPKLGRSHFRTASIFDETITCPDGRLGDLSGNINIVHCGAFLHLFEWDGQVRAIERIVLDILVQRRGCLLLGRQKGCKIAGTYDHSFREQKSYAHNETSFKEIWKEIGDRTGTDWKVDFAFEGGPIHGSGESSKLVISKSGSNKEQDRQIVQSFTFKAERMN